MIDQEFNQPNPPPFSTPRPDTEKMTLEAFLAKKHNVFAFGITAENVVAQRTCQPMFFVSQSVSKCLAWQDMHCLLGQAVSH